MTNGRPCGPTATIQLGSTECRRPGVQAMNNRRGPEAHILPDSAFAPPERRNKFADEALSARQHVLDLEAAIAASTEENLKLRGIIEGLEHRNSDLTAELTKSRLERDNYHDIAVEIQTNLKDAAAILVAAMRRPAVSELARATGQQAVANAVATEGTAHPFTDYVPEEPPR